MLCKTRTVDTSTSQSKFWAAVFLCSVCGYYYDGRIQAWFSFLIYLSFKIILSNATSLFLFHIRMQSCLVLFFLLPFPFSSKRRSMFLLPITPFLLKLGLTSLSSPSSLSLLLSLSFLVTLCGSWRLNQWNGSFLIVEREKHTCGDGREHHLVIQLKVKILVRISERIYWHLWHKQ